MALSVGDYWKFLSKTVIVQSLVWGRNMKCRGEASQELLGAVKREIAPGGFYGGLFYSRV